MRCVPHLARFSAALLLTSVLVATSRADIVFNNFGPGNSFSDVGRLLQGESVGTIADVDQAVWFTNGPTPYTLTSISLGILVTSTPAPGTGLLNVELWSDDFGPQAILATQTLNVNTTGKQIVTANFPPGTTLSPNVQYWVAANARTTFDGSWNFNNIGDMGNTVGRSNNGPWEPRDHATRMAMRIEGTVVPEPATLTLGCAALALVVLNGRR